VLSRATNAKLDTRYTASDVMHKAGGVVSVLRWGESRDRLHRMQGQPPQDIQTIDMAQAVHCNEAVQETQTLRQWRRASSEGHKWQACTTQGKSDCLADG